MAENGPLIGTGAAAARNFGLIAPLVLIFANAPERIALRLRRAREL
jgi:hypothetical protein